MSKKQTIRVLYDKYTVVKDVPATYDEADKLVGEIGAALDGFISDCVARNFLPRLYNNVSKQLIELGHNKNQIREEKKSNGSVKPILESDIVHVGRIRSEHPELHKEIGALFQNAANEIPFFERGERKSGTGGKLAQGAIDAANEFFAQGYDVVESRALFIEMTMPNYKVSRDNDNKITPESLARAIHIFTQFFKKEAERKANNQLKEIQT